MAIKGQANGERLRRIAMVIPCRARLTRGSNDHSVWKYMGGETPSVEAPIDPNVKPRVKDMVYTPNKYRETEGIMV